MRGMIFLRYQDCRYEIKRAKKDKIETLGGMRDMKGVKKSKMWQIDSGNGAK